MLCFRFVCLCLVYPMLPLSLDCAFLIAPLVFSNVYLESGFPHNSQHKTPGFFQEFFQFSWVISEKAWWLSWLYLPGIVQHWHHGIPPSTCFLWSLLFKIPLKSLQTCIWNRIHDLFRPFNTRPKVIHPHIYQTNGTPQNSLVQSCKGTKEQWSNGK